jgi:hypothetical protein
MTEVCRDVTDVAGVEIVRHRIRPGIEHRHLRRPFDVILPFVRVRMPVHLAHAARMDGDERRRDRGRSLEIVAVGDLSHAAFGLCNE